MVYLRGLPLAGGRVEALLFITPWPPEGAIALTVAPRDLEALQPELVKRRPTESEREFHLALAARQAARPSVAGAGSSEHAYVSHQNINECIEPQKALWELVTAYGPLALRVARAFQRPGVDQEDLAQEAILALVDAIRTFDPDKGEFAPYLSRTIWLKLRDRIGVLFRTIKVPNRVLRDMRKVIAVAYAIEGKAAMREDNPYPEGASIAAIAARTRMDEVRVTELLLLSRNIISLSSHHSDEDGEGRDLMASLPGNADDDPAVKVTAWWPDGYIGDLFGSLSDQERTILLARYGFHGEPLTLSEVADELGCSDEWVRKLEKRALDKLRGFDAVRNGTLGNA